MKIRRLNEGEEDIFIIGTQELTDAGFEGDFNELRDELQDRDAVVIGGYDEDGAPTMTITKIDADEIEDVLSSYGIDDPKEFTKDVDDFNDDFDFNKNIEGEEIEPDDADPDDDDFINVEGADGDEEVNVIDDTDEGNGGEDDGDEIDVIDDETNESLDLRRFFAANRRSGGQSVGNLSESATRHILSEVKKIGSKTRSTYQAIMEGFHKRQKNRLNENRIHNQIMGILAEGVSTMVNPKATKSPNADVKVNGRKLSETSDVLLENLLADATKEFAQLSGEYYKARKAKDKKAMKSLTEAVRNQSGLMDILMEERAFRKNSLNEDAIDNAPGQTSDPNNQTIPTGDGEGAQDAPQDGGQENELSNQEANLTGLVFTVKNADDFIKTLTDNGIPADALEKVEDTDANDDGSDGGQEGNQDANGGGTDMGGAPGMDTGMGGGASAPAPAPAANPFESVKPKNGNHLNEADNPFADDDNADNGNPFAEPSEGADTPTDSNDGGGEDTTPDDGTQGGEKVRLKDASYASKVREILADVYKYPTERFDDKIGGQIIDDNVTDDGSDDDGSDDGNDNGGSAPQDDNDKDGVVDDLNPLDVFGDI